MSGSIPVLIIPVINRFDLLERVLKSINYPIDNVLVIDNSGTYELPDGVYDGKITVLNMPANMGVAGSWNLGIKCYPHSPYWMFTTVDSGFYPDTLERLAAVASTEKLVLSQEQFNTYCLGAEVVKLAGIFDENYFPAYCEDTDYMMRLNNLGLNDLVVQSGIPVELYGVNVSTQDNPQYAERNRMTFDSNVGFLTHKSHTPDQYLWTHHKWELQRRIDNEWD